MPPIFSVPPRRTAPLIRRRTALAGMCALAAATAPAAGAHGAENGVSLLLPSPPGGANQLLAGLLAGLLGPRLGQTVTLVNRPSQRGAGYGMVALREKPADGTWLGFAQSSHVLLPLAYPGLEFDPVADFTPLAGWSETPFALIVRTDSPARDLDGLVRLLRTRPGEHRYGSGGPASTQTLATEKLLRLAGVSAPGVQFAGAGPARTSLTNGKVSFVMDMLPAALHAAAAGSVRLLAVGAPARLPVAPALPTFAEELGSQAASLDFVTFSLVIGPPGMPPALARQLHATIRAVQADQAATAGLAGLGSRPLLLDAPEAVAAYMTESRARLEALARQIENG